MRRKPGRFHIVQVIAQQYRRIAAALVHGLQETPAIGGAEVDQRAQFIEQLLDVAFHMSRHHGQRIVAIVAGEDHTVSVQDLAAPGRNRYDRDAVLVRARSQALVAHHLQIP